MPPEFSIILPTFRRPDLLSSAIDSVIVAAASAAAEIIVVDNNSGDETGVAVNRKQSASQVPIRYHIETRQGVSFARNSGAELARGQTLVFMDDDQQMDANYLIRLPHSFAETKADCVGGWTGYVGAAAFPPWLRIVIARTGQRDLGPSLRGIAREDAKLQGGNMAFPRAVFERLGGFRTDVGPAGETTTYGEDWDIQDRLIAAGGRVFYDPQLKQYHIMEPERLTRRYYLDRAYRAGRGDYRLHQGTWGSMPQLLGAPRSLWRKAADSAMRAAASLAGPPDVRFDRSCVLASVLGELREARASRRTVGRSRVSVPTQDQFAPNHPKIDG